MKRDNRVFGAVFCYIFNSKLQFPFEVQVSLFDEDDKEISFLVRRESILVDSFVDKTFFGRVGVDIIKSDEKYYYVKPISLTYPENKEIKVKQDELSCFCYTATCTNCDFGKHIFKSNPLKYDNDLIVVDGKPTNKKDLINNLIYTPFGG